MKKYVYRLLQAELELHQQLKDKVIKIVLSRCQPGYGRVTRGALLAYIYAQLGYPGRIGNDFSRYFSQVLLEEGFRSSYYSGKRIFTGLMWKGEDLKDWRRPLAEDLPKFNGKFFLMPCDSPQNLPSISYKSCTLQDMEKTS